MQLETRYVNRLKELHGTLPNGQPKLRVVTPEEAVRPHGAIKGEPKYFDPASGKQMPFLVLEQWLPADVMGDKETWNYDLLGKHPSQCSLDCCNGGYWGYFMPITNQFGQYIPFNDTVMEAIERQVKIAKEYAKTTEKERLDALNADLAAAEQKQAEVAVRESNLVIEHYLNHKEELDNADNRIIIGLGKNKLPDIKGGKEAIGSPTNI